MQRHRYLTPEDFFKHNESVCSQAFGSKAASIAYALKDLPVHGSETEDLCQVLQKLVHDAGRGRWVVECESNHVVLDFVEWTDHLVASGRLDGSEETGYGDIDWNLEHQKVCQSQLTGFHDAAWAKEKLSSLFAAKDFEPALHMEKSLSYPLPALLDALEREMDALTRNGMSHPYRCSVAIGSIGFQPELASGEFGPTVSLVRRSRVSNIADVVENLKEVVSDHVKDVKKALQEHKETLALLPEGWPSAAVWETAQSWVAKRVKGDAGLMGSDFFDGGWLRESLPWDVQGDASLPDPVADRDGPVEPTESASVGSDSVPDVSRISELARSMAAGSEFSMAAVMRRVEPKDPEPVCGKPFRL